MQTLQSNLLEWYKSSHRQLPWRESSEPYYIWISEIMCQQTQVATVIPYYLRFIDKYKTVYDLAKAKEDDVYKLWEGLGYYSRAKRLMLCAREIANNYNGIFPSDYKRMVSLPGIGPYTAGAILSIAFNIKEPAIDGNVMRVYSRLYNITADIAKPDARKHFDAYVRADLPDDVSHYNQGLMELGATICTPSKPKCDICPIMNQCRAKAEGLVATLPVKSRKPKKKHKNIGVIYLESDDTILLEKRGTEGLLANLWGLPAIELEDGEFDLKIREYLYDVYGIKGFFEEERCKKKHVFTHLVWHMTLYHYRAESVAAIDEPEVAWVKLSEIDKYPLPTAFLKLLS